MIFICIEESKSLKVLLDVKDNEFEIFKREYEVWVKVKDEEMSNLEK